MPGIELLRMITALGMLAVASYYDIKKREVSDLAWIIFGGTGALLYLFESPNQDAILYIISSVIIAIGCHRAWIFGQADCLGLVALAIAFPAHDGIPVAPLVAAATPVLASVFSLCYNLSCNISDLVSGRLFYGICERPHRKALAFVLLHRKRENENFVFTAQSGNKLVFRMKPEVDLEFAGNYEGYVSSALPLMPFMLASLVLILIL